MARAVCLTEDAARDLEELYDYVAEHDSPAKADHLLDRIEATLASLTELPERGSHPKELIELGIHEYRQVSFKPYRLIYRRLDETVYVYLIVDGRRDMRTLLQRRLFAAKPG